VQIKTLSALFKALKEADVRYMVAGGLAVVAHGYLRFTADIDLFLDMNPKNLEVAVGVFQTFGYRPRPPVRLEEFPDPKKREGWMKEKGLTVFSLWSPDHPATEIDLFVEEPIAFQEAEKRCKQVKVTEGVEACIMGLDDLITLKKRAGRPQDLQDIEKLNALRERKNG
jgi:predicted nucleotidyltransferase